MVFYKRPFFLDGLMNKINKSIKQSVGKIYFLGMNTQNFIGQLLV